MSRLVKIVDNKYVQIEEYKNPNICFNTNEYDDFENYCTLRETFDPFEMFYENQGLKKQLEKNQNPLKGIFAQVNDDILLRDCGNMNAEINELKNQQKEFIKWLEDYLNLFDYRNIEEQAGYDMLEEILQKYKKIIGVSDENNK